MNQPAIIVEHASPGGCLNARALVRLGVCWGVYVGKRDVVGLCGIDDDVETFGMNRQRAIELWVGFIEAVAGVSSHHKADSARNSFLVAISTRANSPTKLELMFLRIYYSERQHLWY